MNQSANVVSRRRFMSGLCASAAWGAWVVSCRQIPVPARARTQPIHGSWLSIWWDDRRHFYWNETCRQFTAEQWQLAVKDMADIGFEYLVLLAIAKGGQAFYDTPLLPKLQMACADPIEAHGAC